MKLKCVLKEVPWTRLTSFRNARIPWNNSTWTKRHSILTVKACILSFFLINERKIQAISLLLTKDFTKKNQEHLSMGRIYIGIIFQTMPYRGKKVNQSWRIANLRWVWIIKVGKTFQLDLKRISEVKSILPWKKTTWV